MTSHISQVAFISPSEEAEPEGDDGTGETSSEGKDDDEALATSGDIPRPGPA